MRALQQPQGEPISVGKPELVGRLPVSETTLAIVHKGLWKVVNEPKGTAYGARLPGIEFSGKTGTAQVVGRKEDETQEGEAEELPKDHAWFVAYAPSENPRIAISVMIEHGEHGSSAAAPIAAQLIKTYLGASSADGLGADQEANEFVALFNGESESGFQNFQQHGKEQ